MFPKLFGKTWKWDLPVFAAFLVGINGCSDSRWLTPPPQDWGATLNSKANEGYPRFSYDGHYLIFTSDRNYERNIFLYDVQQRRLVALPGLNLPNVMQDQPDLSADGRYIVYVSEQRGKPDVFIYDRQTFRSEPITNNFPGEIRHPTISGNGRFVAFEYNRGGQWDIEIYDRGPNIELSLPSSQSSSPETPSVDLSPVPKTPN